MNNQEAHHHDNSQFWIGLFFGGLIGALLIVLMGTEKGRKLAKKLQAEGLDLWDDAKDKFEDKKEAVEKQVIMKVEQVEEKGAELIEKGKELLEESKELEEKLVKKAARVKDDVTLEAVAKADQALAHIERLQEHGRETTAELRKRLFKNIPKKS